MAAIKSKGRRHFLIGTGKAVISLPFLSEVAWMEYAMAQEVAPIRLVTFNYANGLPPDLAAKGLVGGLRALNAVKNKVSLVRSIDARGSGTGAHREPGMGLFVGRKAPDSSRSVGPSMDYFAYKQINPGTHVDVLSVGIGGNTETPSRYIRSWRANGTQRGTPVPPVDRPRQLFTDIFGAAPGGGGDGGDGGGSEGPTKEQKLKRSVLDAVVEQYKSVKAPRSGYSPNTKRKVSEHLDRLYEVERATLELDIKMMTNRQEQTFEQWYSQIDPGHYLCQAPDPYRSPARGIYSDSDRTIKDRQAINYPEWCWAWPVLSELFSLALVTNYANFGSLVAGFGGERYKNIGPEGNLEHHEYYHRYNNDKGTKNTSVVEHWLNEYIGRLAKTIQIMDSIPAEQGKSLLDTTILVAGTEHDYQHKNNNMTFIVAGRPDAIKLGQNFANSGYTDVDFYNTILNQAGVNVSGSKFGDGGRFKNYMPFAK